MSIQLQVFISWRPETPQQVRDLYPWIDNPPKVESLSVEVDA